jgi:CRP-like cAMP-binding protein
MADPDIDCRDLIRRIPFFAAVTEAEAARLSRRCPERRVAAEQIIFHRGDPGHEMLIIRSGCVKLFLPSEDGSEQITIAMLRDGDFFGELALLDGQPRTASAMAVTDTVLLPIARNEFCRLLEREPRAALHVIAVLSQRLRDLDARLGEIVFLDVPERLAKQLCELAECGCEETAEGRRIERSLSDADLAHMIGTSTERVREELRRLQREFIITVDDGTITISKPHDLRDLALGRRSRTDPIAVPDWLLA